MGVAHIYLLVGFQNRLLVTVRWLWAYLTFQRGARLIAEDVSRASVRSTNTDVSVEAYRPE
jgi:NADH:ubiquinone reductase (H+-translocating)